ncbi:caspase-8-like [Pseudophryne corroboree]|uniref:caspase-8-like n=1 Tax=Pseudophryne corroboree TaxID=495146 RepID=UPI003081E9FC
MADQVCQWFSIIEQLDSVEIRELYFLCRDLIPRHSKDSEEEGTVLFIRLQEMCLISEEDPGLVKELLSCIERGDLLREHFSVDKKTHQSPDRTEAPRISPYRRLLFDFGNLVPDSELEQVKAVVTGALPVAVLERVTSVWDIITALEQRAILTEHDLSYLREISRNFDGDFLDKVLQYEEQYSDLKPDICCSQGNTTSAADHPEPTDQFYRMISQTRGTCLIISNFSFRNARIPLKDRSGTDKDKESLHKVFSRLGFRVSIEEDLQGDRILSTVRSYSQRNHEESDGFVCCLLTHGDKGTVYGTDGHSVPIRDLTSCFCSSSCPSLEGKPKLFFIQACQGSQHQTPVPLETDACNVSPARNVALQDLIPNEPDFLLGMATTLHHVSYRHPRSGSWYIQALCAQLEESYPRGEDIISILTKVNRDLSQQYVLKFNGSQMPEPWTTLRRKLIFS